MYFIDDNTKPKISNIINGFVIVVIILIGQRFTMVLLLNKTSGHRKSIAAPASNFHKPFKKKFLRLHLEPTPVSIWVTKSRDLLRLQCRPSRWHSTGFLRNCR